MKLKEEVTVTHFDVTRCGYFVPFARNNAHLFGDAESMLADLASWSAGVDLVQTQTYAPGDELLPTYLLDVKSAKREYLVGTWNGTADSSGNVLSVPATAKVGSAQATTAVLPPGNIAGYATYFWFRPDQQEFSTVQFAGGLNGRQNMLAYTNAFLAKFNPRHVVAKGSVTLKADVHRCIEGYREAQDDTLEVLPLEKAYPVFESLLVRNEGRINEIKRNLASVHTIIRKETITATTAAGKSHLGGIMGVFGVEKARTNEHDYRVRYQIKYRPTAAEFDAMVETYKAVSGNGWDDIGFLMTGRSSPLWLSGSMARTKAEIEVVRNGHVVDAPQLLRTLQLHRAELLKK
ncbi:hypothetical protein [Caballeronia sp. KNU42]